MGGDSYNGGDSYVEWPWSKFSLPKKNRWSLDRTTSDRVELVPPRELHEPGRPERTRVLVQYTPKYYLYRYWPPQLSLTTVHTCYENMALINEIDARIGKSVDSITKGHGIRLEQALSGQW